jgi:hypothetical protein
MFARPQHALISAPERVARRRETDRLCQGFVQGKRELKALGRRNAVAAQLERNRQAAEAAAAQASQPMKPVSELTRREFQDSKRRYLRTLRVGG